MKEAYNLINNNPILKNSKQYEKLENSYKLAYNKASLGFTHQDKIPFIKLKSIYANITTKEKDIQNLKKAFDEYKHLKDLYLEKKYSICYALIQKHPQLKVTQEYKQLQKRYHSSMLAAQHYIGIKRKDLAQMVLNDYITIHSKREDIKALFEKQTQPVEIDTTSEIDTNIVMFENYYQNNNFKRCYELIDTYIYLNDLEIANLLNKHYQNVISKCDKFALDGDIQNVQKELEALLKITTRKKKTGSLLRVSFQAKIKNLLKIKNFRETENMIYSYIDIFGIDDDINKLTTNFEQISNITLAISEHQQIKKDEYAWFYSEFFENKSY
jgi:hypothetical protein